MKLPDSIDLSHVHLYFSTSPSLSSLTFLTTLLLSKQRDISSSNFVFCMFSIIWKLHVIIIFIKNGISFSYGNDLHRKICFLSVIYCIFSMYCKSIESLKRQKLKILLFLKSIKMYIVQLNLDNTLLHKY